MTRYGAALGRDALLRIDRVVAAAGGEIGSAASAMLERHGYTVTEDAPGPHTNVLGHPLFELPLWLSWDPDRRLPESTMADICESSLSGYLAVRAEDDFFDEAVGDAGTVMMLAGFFRVRHQMLLAPLVSHPAFWERFGRLWHAYAEAMLLERSLHQRSETFGTDDFERVLARSQPLEIPGLAVMALQGRWQSVQQLAEFVRHITRATQTFNDFVDAPKDLALGNHTHMLRRLGGMDGPASLARGMIEQCDRIVSESNAHLDRAVEIAHALEMEGFEPWFDARRSAMAAASDRMYRALFSPPSREEA